MRLGAATSPPKSPRMNSTLCLITALVLTLACALFAPWLATRWQETRRTRTLRQQVPDAPPAASTLPSTVQALKQRSRPTIAAVQKEAMMAAFEDFTAGMRRPAPYPPHARLHLLWFAVYEQTQLELQTRNGFCNQKAKL